MIIICNKDFKKLDKTIKNTINKNIKKLENKILNYKKQNIEFNKIFNDDNLKHRVFKNNFFAFKIIGTVQIRVLCRYKNNNIEIHKIYIKNTSIKKTETEYITLFKKYVNTF